ncbi:ribosomal protein S5 domain 2-type protein [Paraphysoderma sedebokerense]|nr:ribosomal protein S5 domain 2-type protein [Paraphysoderma sedebokerense]
MSNEELIEEEILALEAIYSTDYFYPDPHSPLPRTYLLQINSDSLPSSLSPTIRIHFPSTYPSSSPPIYEFTENYSTWTDDIRFSIESEFQSVYEDSHGQVVVFEWIEWLKTFLEQNLSDEIENVKREEDLKKETEKLIKELQDAHLQEEESKSTIEKPSTPPSSSLTNPDTDFPTDLNSTPSDIPRLYTHSDPIIDRKSVFIAHAASVSSIEEVNKAKNYLLSFKKIAKSTHNITAYRIVLESGAIQRDCDDDGEDAAGGRLAHLLDLLNATNVFVMVSRWYGGVKLGPARFAHINNAARLALQSMGVVKEDKSKKKDRNSSNVRVKNR